MNSIDAIKSCDAWLRSTKSSVIGELIIVGGAALNWSNYTDRNTTDVDTIGIEGGPDAFTMVQTLRSFADTPEGKELELDREWINMAASSFIHLMMVNWQNDLELLYEGSNIRQYCPSRANLVILKLVAATDRGRQDIDDLRAMQPSDAMLSLARTHLSHLSKTNASVDLAKIDAVIAQLGRGADAS